jgi:hypothetical protein
MALAMPVISSTGRIVPRLLEACEIATTLVSGERDLPP